MLKKLDPAPGKNFRPARFCLADIEFIPTEDEIKVRLMLENMPSVSANCSDLQLSGDAARSSHWARGEWRAAKETLTRLGLRYRTLLRIAGVIKDHQGEMIRDMTHLPAPLVYEQAAQRLGLDASTIFRAVQHTFCRICGRNYPMRIFFHRAAASRPDVSSEALRASARELRAAGLTNREIASRLMIPVRTASYYTCGIKRGKSVR